jgi:RND family efflux transporter MFP subunit
MRYAVLLLVASHGLAGCADPGVATPGTGAASLSVSVASVQHGDHYTRDRLLTGRVEANRQSDIGFELAGQLREVQVDEGDNVSRSQTLASLSIDRLAARRAEVQAQLAQTRAQVKLARSTLARVEDALTFRGVSQQEVDEARNGLATAEAAAAAALARRDSIDVDIDKSLLTAPFDAVVTARHADEGQVLQPGQPVLSLQERARLTLRVGVAGVALDVLTPGTAHEVLVGGAPIRATVRQQLPQRDRITRTVDVLLDLSPDSGQHVRAGDLARLQVSETLHQRGAWVPLSALTEGTRGLWSAFVATPEPREELGATHRVQPRPVEIIYQDGERAYVRGALEDGDSVVISGLHRVVAGQFVRLDKGLAQP